MKTIRYPVPESIAAAASDYARLSSSHTANHPGWEDEHKKRVRIETGRCAQLCIVRLCELNKVPAVADESPYDTPDDTDLTIRGARVDVKTSSHGVMPHQVNEAVVRTAAHAYYCFTRIDPKLRWISIDGFISAGEFRRRAVFVRPGERIPGTRIEQRFGHGSWFLADDTQLVPFAHALRIRREHDWHVLSGRPSREESAPCPACSAPMELTVSGRYWLCHACSRQVSHGIYYAVWPVGLVVGAGAAERRAS